jgi:mono/diheme cytochrome c family protein
MSRNPRPFTIPRHERLRAFAAACLLAAAPTLSGCIQEMANQPRAEAYESNAFFPDGLASRPQVEGTIARGQPWEDTPELTGKTDGKPVDRIPVAVTSELVRRGQERFNIFCSHCHGRSGYADGMVVQRGFPAPPSYHIDRLRDEPDGRLFDVITNGLGRMPAFGSRIPPADRWAIASYIRALQLSQNTPADSLNAEQRGKLSP